MDFETRVETTHLTNLVSCFELFFVSLILYNDNVVTSLMRLAIVTLVARGFRAYDIL